MQLSFIIVNYNVTELLRKCLLSIQKYSDGLSYEVIIVDNDSSDQSWKELIREFSSFKFIAADANLGFAKANNRAVEHAAGAWLYFLNPDTELEGYYLQEILEFASMQKNFGSLGLRMHNAEGNFLPESKRAVPDVINSFQKLFIGQKTFGKKSYYRDDINENDIAPVEILTGANLLIRKETYLKAGGFDERYFMYGEDIDLCYTLLNMGLQNFYYGKFSVLHHKGESTVKDEKYLRNFYGAMDLFIDKYYQDKPLQKMILKMGLLLKKSVERFKIKHPE